MHRDGELASRASDGAHERPRSVRARKLRMAYALTSEMGHAGHTDDSRALSRAPIPQIIYVRCRTH